MNRITESGGDRSRWRSSPCKEASRRARAAWERLIPRSGLGADSPSQGGPPGPGRNLTWLLRTTDRSPPDSCSPAGLHGPRSGRTRFASIGEGREIHPSQSSLAPAAARCDHTFPTRWKAARSAKPRSASANHCAWRRCVASRQASVKPGAMAFILTPSFNWTRASVASCGPIAVFPETVASSRE